MKTSTVALLVLVSALAVPGAYSQQDSEVYLSLSRAALTAPPKPADADDIYVQEPAAGSADSAADLLGMQLPVLLRQTEGGGLATAGLRGFSAKQTAVLYDGMRIPADLTGIVDLSALPAGGIQRIEVLPGAWSSVEGANAEGGVINFVSRTPAPGVTRADLSSSLASYGGNSGAVSFMKAGNLATASLTASRDASDGFQQNSAWRKEFYSGKTEAKAAGGKLSFDFLRNNSYNGIPGGTPVPIGDWDGSREKAADSLTDYQRSALGLAKAAFELPLGRDSGCTLSAGSGVNRLYSHTAWGDELTPRAPGRASLGFSLFGRGEAGLDYEKEQLRSGTYGAHFRQNTGLFAQWAFEPLKGLSMIPSFRYDSNVTFDDQSSPKLAVVYAPDFTWKFSAQTGRAWQAPTFADIYNPFVPAADRSPDLKPEHSWQTQAAAAGNFPSGVWTKLAVYYSDVRDRIALDPARSWAAYNLASAFNEGAEAGLGYKASGAGVGLGYAYNVSRGRTGAGAYQQLAFSPKYRLTLDASLSTPWGDISSKAYYSGPQYTAINGGGLKLPCYLTENLYFSRKFDRFEVFAGADNLFDAHYAQTADAVNGYYPMPGRVLKGGLTVRFI